MALTEEQREIALTVNRSMDKRNAFGNFEAFCVEFAARFLAALPKQEPVYYQWRRKADPWSTSFIFSNEAKATSDDSEVRQLYTEATIAQPASAPSVQKPIYQFRPECENWIDCTEQFYESWRGEKRELYAAPQPDYKAQRNELREQVECSSIVIDNLESRLNKATVKLAAMKQQRDAFLDAAKNAVTVAESAYEAWDNDQDAKVGKYLKALCGCLPGYDKRTDELHAAIASVKGGA